jgi:hypothetical protein
VVAVRVAEVVLLAELAAAEEPVVALLAGPVVEEVQAVVERVVPWFIVITPWLKYPASSLRDKSGRRSGKEPATTRME